MNKITVLTEYKAEDGKKENVLSAIDELKEQIEALGGREVIIYEGVDQPGLFVEQFLLPNMQAYEKMKRIREEERIDFWQTFNSYILGGKKKINMWAFEKK
ncbi:hypothetical protein M3202_06990 [Alkalihalobacillus oceani]|uniref:Uncharacterized protein n=1 Tax=Halalkalibacter oceani TaxID=1653776 RepID=A0A9X2INI3_9BACI|nr:hypothetical protein [Halalkalibacter oceani]MCM3713826.1 hypothetical protein [Halalkalibacter oceani]